MYAPYSDEAVLILAKEAIRERTARRALPREPKPQSSRKTRTDTRAMEAEMDQMRARATSHVYA